MTVERLTYKIERKRGDKWEGGYYTKHNKQQLVDVLAAYEDTGLTPEQLRQIDRLYAEECRGGGRAAAAGYTGKSQTP